MKRLVRWSHVLQLSPVGAAAPMRLWLTGAIIRDAALKIQGLLTCWLNTSPPLNPTWLASWLPLTRAGQRNPRWKIVIERLQSKQRARNDFITRTDLERTWRLSDSPTCGNEEAQIVSRSTSTPAQAAAALLLFHLLSFHLPPSRRQWDKKDAADGGGCN